jgi:hypothetical protein
MDQTQEGRKSEDVVKEEIATTEFIIQEVLS